MDGATLRRSARLGRGARPAGDLPSGGSEGAGGAGPPGGGARATPRAPTSAPAGRKTPIGRASTAVPASTAAGASGSRRAPANDQKWRLQVCAIAFLRTEAGLHPSGVSLGRYGKCTRYDLLKAFGCKRDKKSITNYADKHLRVDEGTYDTIIEMSEEEVERDFYAPCRVSGAPQTESDAPDSQPWAQGLSQVEESLRAKAARKASSIAVSEKQVTPAKAASKLESKGVSISARTIARDAADNPGASPALRPGPAPTFSADVERAFASRVRALRSLKVQVSCWDVIAMAQASIEGTKAAERFKREQVSTGWYQRWVKRMVADGHLGGTGAAVPHTCTREEWTSPANLKASFDMIAGVYKEANVAVDNPNFDPAVPNSEMLIVTKPDNVTSLDETSFGLDQKKDTGKANQEQTLLASADDDGQVLVSTASCRCSVVVGSRASGTTNTPHMIFAGSIPVAPPDEYPRGGLDEPAILACNTKGSADTAMCVDYFERVQIPWLQRIGVSGTSRVKAVELCDGWGPHLDEDLLRRKREAGLLVGLRMANTSHETNGEDLVTFGVAKPEFRNAKKQLMKARLIARVKTQLEPTDMPLLIKQALDKACTPKLNRSGWEKAGCAPFTRAPYWRAVARDEAAREAAAEAARAIAGTAQQQLRFDDLNTAALGALGANLQDNLALKRSRAEHASRRGAAAAARGADDDASDSGGGSGSGSSDGDDQDGGVRLPKAKRNRLTSRNICLVSGGANGDNALAILRKDNEEKEARAAEKAAKAAARRANKEATKGAVVKLGSQCYSELRAAASVDASECILRGFKVGQLQALLFVCRADSKGLKKRELQAAVRAALPGPFGGAAGGSDATATGAAGGGAGGSTGGS